ncbi:hypothetical protein PG985_007243 [Apiospora marii]|uniref:N-acetyltransferase domain-containing protein n=1 Tax=Apiospora marii TaxID=335849 RepID=A0ABR1SEM2_9PEZI
MADSNSNTVDEWAIELVPANDAGRAFYLAEYKPFRLAALKQDPHAFGSTYAREAAFPDETWLERLSDPRIKMFVVVRRHDRRILSAVSLIGPMPHAGQLVANPTQALLSQTAPSGHGSTGRTTSTTSTTTATTTTSTGHQESGEGREEEEKEGKEGDHHRQDKDAPLLYQNASVYTRPEARGRGLGLKLMATAVECVRQEARRQKRECRLGVEVYKTNHAAISFYKRCGFEATATEAPESEDDAKRPELCMYYKDFLQQ